MRSFALIAALPLLALTACGGASGPQTAGSIAPPAGGVSGGPGGGIGGGSTPSPTPTPTPSSFLDVSAETSFDVVGSFQALGVNETGDPSRPGAVLYRGNASTVRTPSGQVTYNPRDGIFVVSFTDTKSGVEINNLRFQDPGHRTEVGVWGVPTDLTDFNYLEVLGPSAAPPSPTDPTDLGRADVITFFYQRPGSKTTYVSLAGYVRNAYNRTNDPLVFKNLTTSVYERGAMVFGTPTLRSQIPVSGEGSYSGGMLATMVVNTTLDSPTRQPNYFQWIDGSADITIDFGSSTLKNLTLSGTVSAANYAGVQLPDNATGVPGGSTFKAVGSGTVDLTRTGGFTGNFSSVTFTTPGGQTITPSYDNVNSNTPVAGANSIDGTFFGPNAVNVGGNFRIVGGVPDQRVDILGAFTGAKK